MQEQVNKPNHFGMNLAAVISTMRLPFLILTPACLLLAFSLAYQKTGLVQWSLIGMISIGAICAHIAVNMLNEYSDFHSGLDFVTSRTPFSGGSGGLVAQPTAQRAVLVVASINLLICCLLGLYMAFTIGRELLSIGLIGVVIIVSYTRWINRLPFLCLISPGLAFGVLLVNGSYFVLTQSFDMEVFFVSLVPFFVVNNLLLLNQFPDIEADKAHGRNHLLIKYGIDSGVRVYSVFALLSVLTLAMLIAFGKLPMLSAIGILPLLMALVIGNELKRSNFKSSDTTDNQKLMSLMGKNVAVTILTPTLLAVSIVLATHFGS
jgi:1,4-dihydroxy-2-naphthoate octaprenyltransferase